MAILKQFASLTTQRAGLVLVLAAGSFLGLRAVGVTGLDPEGVTLGARGVVDQADLPLAFEPTCGKVAGEAAFLARMGGQHVRVFPGKLEVSGSGRENSSPGLTFLGANPEARLVGETRLPGVVHYWIGAPENWRTEVLTFAAVRYVGIYPGVDLMLSGDKGKLELKFDVAPGADAERIRFNLDHGLRLDASATPGRFTLRAVVRKPSSPDLDEGLRVATDPSGHLYLAGSVASLRAGDAADAFVAKLTPDGSSVMYTAYFGGAGADRPNAIAVDGEGRVFVTGRTPGTIGRVPGGTRRRRQRARAFHPHRRGRRGCGARDRAR